MAVDTRQKRESSVGICLPFTRVLPLPDGGNADSEDERAHLCMNYNGIATAANALISQARASFRHVFARIHGRVN